jgi:hypothetical protein
MAILKSAKFQAKKREEIIEAICKMEIPFTAENCETLIQKGSVVLKGEWPRYPGTELIIFKIQEDYSIGVQFCYLGPDDGCKVRPVFEIVYPS